MSRPSARERNADTMERHLNRAEEAVSKGRGLRTSAQAVDPMQPLAQQIGLQAAQCYFDEARAEAALALVYATLAMAL